MLERAEDIGLLNLQVFSALGSFAMTATRHGCAVAEFTHEFREKTTLGLAETLFLSYFSSKLKADFLQG